MASSSPDRKRRVLVVQLEPLHTEVLLSVAAAIGDVWDVVAIVHPLIARMLPDHALGTLRRVQSVPAPRGRAARTVFRKLRVPSLLSYLSGLWTVLAWWHAYRADAIIFVTIADRTRARLVRLFLPAPRIVNIVHNVQRFDGQHRRIVRRFAANVVLSHDIVRAQQQRPVSDRMPGMRGYLPVHHVAPAYQAPPVASVGDEDTDRDLTLAVPGSVNTQRRNYEGLFNSVRENLQLFRQAGIRFLIVGRTPRAVVRRISQLGIADRIEARAGFWSFTDLFAALQASDAIAFLIDKSIDNAEYYNRSKISGTSPLAIALNKPVISSTDFAVDTELRDQTVWYRGDVLSDVAARTVPGTDGAISSESLNRLRMDPAAHRAILERERRTILGIVDAAALPERTKKGRLHG